MEEPLATPWPALPDGKPNQNPMNRAAEIIDEIRRWKPILYARVREKLDEWRKEWDKHESRDISERKAFREWLYNKSNKSPGDKKDIAGDNLDIAGDNLHNPGENLHLEDFAFAAWCVEHNRMSPETVLFIFKSAAGVKNGGFRRDILGTQWGTYINEFLKNEAYKDPMFDANFKKEPKGQLTKAWTDHYNAGGLTQEKIWQRSGSLFVPRARKTKTSKR